MKNSSHTFQKMRSLFSTFAMMSFVVAAVFSTGCSSLEKIVQKPKVEFDHVTLKDSDLNSTTAVFVVKVENPNDIDIKVNDIAYTVFLSGQEFAKANTGKVINVPAKGHSMVEIPLPVQYSKLVGGLQSLLTNKPVDYRIEGDAKLSLFSIPFKKEGEFKLRE